MTVSLNKQKEKEWLDLVKEISKKSGWKFNSFLIYKLTNTFLFEASIFVSGKEDLISVWLSFKPYDIDSLFWDIVDLKENKKKPLSFRARGAFTLRATKIINFKKNITLHKPQEDIEDILKVVNDTVNQTQQRVTNIDTFISYIVDKPDRKDNWLDTDLLIVIYISQNNFEEALRLLLDAKERRGMCSYGFGDKDFYDLAIEYCQKRT